VDYSQIGATEFFRVIGSVRRGQFSAIHRVRIQHSYNNVKELPGCIDRQMQSMVVVLPGNTVQCVRQVTDGYRSNASRSTAMRSAEISLATASAPCAIAGGP
jgi:hypothetical protein